MAKYTIAASDISVLNAEPSKRHMSVRMRLLSTRKNLNGVAVTEAFIDNIIANREDYVCMPLCADVRSLEKKNYQGLTHMQDRKTGRFYADEIGSFYSVEKVVDEFGVSLLGEARINKRNPAVCSAVEELYALGRLNFSFEIEAEHVQELDDALIIDAMDGNELLSMAVVSVPAYPEAHALALVAEADKNEMYKKVFENAMILSEIDMETWHMRLMDALEKKIGECLFWEHRILLIGRESIVLYHVPTGKMMRVEYKIENEELYLGDIYEVEVTPVMGDENMNTNEVNTVVEEVEVVQAAEQEQETVVEAQQENEIEVVAETEVAESETQEVEAEDTEEVTAEAEEQTEQEAQPAEPARDYEAELQVLRDEVAAYKAELEIMKEAAEAEKLRQRQEKIRAFAERNNCDLNSEAVKKAIAEVDYEALAEEIPAVQPPVVSQRIVSEINHKPFGGMLEREN